MSNARILVVDDEPQIRRVMRATLAAQGYFINDARSGEDAIEKLREEKYDLVLLDMNMPGWEAWRRAARSASSGMWRSWS